MMRSLTRTTMALSLVLALGGACVNRGAVPYGRVRGADRVRIPGAPAEMGRTRVYVSERFGVAPSVQMPMEMRDVSEDTLVQVARQQTVAELGQADAFQVTLQDPGSEPSVHRVEADIMRVQLSRMGDDGTDGQVALDRGGWVEGQTASTMRVLVVDVNYRVVDTNGTVHAAATGQSGTPVPVSGIATFLAGAGSDRGRWVLREGSVDRGALAPAFQTAASVATRDLQRQVVQEWERQQALNRVGR